MKTLLGEMDLSGVKQIQWGIQHEKTAIELYEKAFEVQCYIFTMLRVSILSNTFNARKFH